MTNRRLEEKKHTNKERTRWHTLLPRPLTTTQLPPGSAGASGAYSGVAEFGHGGRHRCGHGGGVEAVFPTLPPIAPAALAAEAVTTTTGKGGQQSLAKTRVHEAVNDGVDAG